MRLIEITALENGAHRNQMIMGEIVVPDGWAVVPDGLETENYPFGTVEVAEIDGVMTVTAWTPGTTPDTPTPTAEPTAQDDTDAMLIDHEYRITLLELGVE